MFAQDFRETLDKHRHPQGSGGLGPYLWEVMMSYGSDVEAEDSPGFFLAERVCGPFFCCLQSSLTRKDPLSGCQSLDQGLEKP